MNQKTEEKVGEKIVIDSVTPFARSRRLSSLIEKEDITVYRDAIVLLPRNVYWKLVFVLSIVVHLILVMYNEGYSQGKRIIFVYIFDFLFFVDWFLHLLLILHPEKICIVYKPRSSVAMVIDAFSMIPLEYFHPDLEVFRIIRVYRITNTFSRRRTRTGSWPVFQKLLELTIIVLLIGCIGGRILYGITCEKLVHVGCGKLLLTYRSWENYSNEMGPWYWYTKSQYLMINELTRAGFPFYQGNNVIDEIVIFIFIVFHIIFYLYVVMPLTATAFMQLRRTQFSLSAFVPFLNAILQVHNKMDLSPQIVDHYRQVRGRRGVPSEVKGFQNLPQTLQKEISMNIHWEMVRSTSFFRITNMNVRRNLALIAGTCYVAPGHAVVSEGEVYDRMMYIVNGTVVFMKGNNNIAYFQKGTSFGGVNLFYKCQSAFTIKCVTYCEFDFIEREAFQNLADENGDVREQCTVAIRDRIADAQEIKRMGDLVTQRVSFVDTERLTPVQWLERRFYELKNKTPKSKGTNEASDLNEFLYTDKYISDFVFAPTPKHSAFEYLQGVLIPGSTFLSLWTRVSTIVIVTAAFLLPYFACLENRISIFLFVLTGLQIPSYLIDLFLDFFSAEETDDGVVTNPIKILRIRCKKYILYVDIITIFPILTLYDESKTLVHPLIATAISIHCLKISKLFEYANSRRYEDIELYNGWRITKFLLILLYPILMWTVFLYALTCTLETCGKQGWATFQKNLIEPVLLHALAIVTITATGVSFWQYILESWKEFVIMIIALITFTAIFVYVYGDITSRLTLQRRHFIQFEAFRRQILGVMSERRVKKDLQDRALSCVDAIGSVTDYHISAYRKKHVQYLPNYMSKMIFTTPIIETLNSLKLFSKCSEALINQLLDIADIHILPPGEIVVIAGHLATHLFILDEGVCKYVNHTPPVLLRKGDVFPLVEVLGHFAVLNSVKCLTFCRFITLDYYAFKEILERYSDFEKDIDQTLRRILNEEIRRDLENAFNLMEDVPTADLVSIYDKTRYLFSSNRDPKGKTSSFLKRLFSKDAILPHGKFMIYMEVARIFFSVVTAFLFPIRRVIGLYFYANYFYLILFLDITAYIDIFFRFRYAYHDKMGHLITSPMNICLHYLTHSLAIDIFACFPFDFIFHKFLKEGKLSILEGILYLNRVFQVYRMRQIPSILKSFKIGTNIALMLLFYTIFWLILVNTMATFTLVTVCDMNPNTIDCENFLASNSRERPIFVYVYHVTWFLSIIGNNCCDGMVSVKLEPLIMIILIIFGYVFRLLVYCIFSSCHDFSEIYASLVNHHHHTALLVSFMKEGKLKPKTRNAVLDYYYANWIRTKNIELVPLLKTVHPSLCIEILFNIFGEKLRKCQILSDLGDEAIRVILPIARYIHAPKRSRLCRVNDIIGETHILVKGSVIVEGPGREVYAAYGEGIMFGNIEPVEWSRQSVTVIAVDHVEVLAFRTTELFQRLKNFPLFDDVISLYTQYHVDYIPPGTLPSEEKTATLQLIKQKELKHLVVYGRIQSFLQKVLFVPYNPSLIGWKIQQIIFVIFTIIVYVTVFAEIGFRRVSKASSVIIYFSDIVQFWVMFYKSNCAFYNEYGELVTNCYVIFDRYCHSRELVIDVISVIPLDIVYLVRDVEYITAWMRLNRCLRIRDIFIYLKIKPNRLNMKFFFKMTFFSILVVVFTLIPLSALYVVMHPEKKHDFHLFLVGTYHTLHLFAMADWPCVEMDNIWQLVFLSLASQVTHALWVFSVVQFYSITRTMYYSKEYYARRTHQVLRYLRRRNVPKSLVKEAWSHSRFLWHEWEGDSEPQLVTRAPHLMRQLIKYTVYGPFIRKHGFYRHLHRDFLRQMIDKSKRFLFYPGNVIVLSGIADQCTYFLCWGTVEEIVENPDLSQEKTRDLHGGDVFGIVQGVFPASLHRHTYRAITKCRILILKYDDWCHLLDFFPAVKNEMYHSANSMYIFSVD